MLNSYKPEKVVVKVVVFFFVQLFCLFVYLLSFQPFLFLEFSLYVFSSKSTCFEKSPVKISCMEIRMPKMLNTDLHSKTYFTETPCSFSNCKSIFQKQTDKK